MRARRVAGDRPAVLLARPRGRGCAQTAEGQTADAPAAEGQAAEDQEPIDLETLELARKARAAQFTVSNRVSRYLDAAGEASAKGDPAKAKSLLDKLNLKTLNPYERALVYRLKAFVAYAAGDFDGMIDYLNKVLAEEIMDVETDQKIRFTIAQVYGTQQQWNNVISALQNWFRYSRDPNPVAYYLLGIAYYQLEKLDLAISNTEKAVELADQPAEGWLQFLAALYIQKENYALAAPILEDLVTRFPKKTYWLQLSLVYGSLKDSKHILAVQELAYRQGLLTEDQDLRRLARAYVYHDMPHPAATVLEKGIASGEIKEDVGVYELIANSWIAAREYDRSLPPLRKAAELSSDGKLFVRLGQVYLQREEWNEAAQALQQGIEKGGLENPGSVYLMQGIAYYNANHVPQARASFAQAQTHESTRVEADRWITYLGSGESGALAAPEEASSPARGASG
jgi:tetratricopeptide (TPR) repeat protein